MDISIADENSPHILLTGKNGSGKTILLNAIANYLDTIKDDTRLNFLDYENNLDAHTQAVNDSDNEFDKAKNQNLVDYYSIKISDLKGQIEIFFDNISDIINLYNHNDFIIAFYQAARKTKIDEPKNPTKPILNLKGESRLNITSQLLNFLSDLKIQEALAKNDEQFEDAHHINSWFVKFEKILKNIFEDQNLKLQFNYKDYTFTINTDGKSFKFTELSDGFIAILDIVADLILKMQDGHNLIAEFNKPGIVLIDEIETHLHLQLQKQILPLLTTLFPNIQFIVSTHSPFVLSSNPNATAYDLENKEVISDLTNYSYEALTEGYFRVSTQSDYGRQRYQELESLLKKDSLSPTERITVKQLYNDYKRIPEFSAPELVGAYRNLEIIYNDKIRKILAP